MIAVARVNAGAVLDSVWPPYTIPMLRDLPGSIVEVRCEVSRQTAFARYAAFTGEASGRPAVHLRADPAR